MDAEQDQNSIQNDEGGADDDGLTGVLSHEQVNAMIGNTNPPKPVKQALHFRTAQLVHYQFIPRQDPQPGPNVDELGIDERLVKKLQEQFKSFYMYQADAITRILKGESVVIEAPTAFGKTEAFLVPIVHQISRIDGRGVKALFVYPTKALGRDQLQKISKIANVLGIRVSIYDGDTPIEERQNIANNPPEIIITNFDLLHHQMFRQKQLANLLHTVKFLVVDETHEYTGVFGANVYYIISRLKRFSQPLQIIASSATLTDSATFCTNLFEQQMHVVKATGRRSGIDFAMMTPAVRKIGNNEKRLSNRTLMVLLARKISLMNSQTMVFSNSHRGAEHIGAHLKDIGLNADVHRGGITSKHLSSVEKRFREGYLSIISCTPTLELGIDMGSVDSVVSETIASNRFMQRIGRAGRTGNRGCAFLSLGDDPISQYYVRHPNDYMNDKWIPYIDKYNQEVAQYQTVAMACDKPLEGKDIKKLDRGIIRQCFENGLLKRDDLTFSATEKGQSALKTKYSIRGIGENIDILHNGRIIGTRNLPVAISELHVGAVYMMGGKRYIVKHLRYPHHKSATLVRVPKGSKLETRALSDYNVRNDGIISERKCYNFNIKFCQLRIQKIVTGYLLIDAGKIIKKQLPEPLKYTFMTKGITFCVPSPVDAMSSGDTDVVEYGARHAVEHVIVDASRMITGASYADINGVLGPSNTLYVYDDTANGNGASQVIYDRFEDVIIRAHNIVFECPCKNKDGCPRCTLVYRCVSQNDVLHKAGAIESLQILLSKK